MKKKIPKVIDKQSVHNELKCEVSHKFILHTIRGYISKKIYPTNKINFKSTQKI